MSPVYILKEADLLLHTGQLDAAASLYEGVIGTDRADPRAYFGLAEVRRIQRRFDEAIDSLRRAHQTAEDESLRELLATARGAEGYRHIERTLAQSELDSLLDRRARGAYTSPSIWREPMPALVTESAPSVTSRPPSRSGVPGSCS